jgi:hypothetical protein
MDLKILQDRPPWEWPEDAGATFLNVLRDTQAAESDRQVAAELAGNLVAINDELVGALQTVLCNDVEPEKLRAKAAISLGPVLEHADTDGFEDPDDVPITERTFQAIQVRSTKEVKVINNIFPGPGTPLAGPGNRSHNLQTNDPGFVNRTKYDYHLKAGSPAI